MSVLIETQINEILAWENVEVVVHMLKISCGSSVVSILYYVFTVLWKKINGSMILEEKTVELYRTENAKAMDSTIYILMRYYISLYNKNTL